MNPPAPPAGTRLRDLKARAQLLEPVLHLGRAGLTPAFVAALDAALRARVLVKIRFAEHKEDRKRLAAELARRTGSRLVQQVGHVAVFHRPRPEAAAASTTATSPPP